MTCEFYRAFTDLDGLINMTEYLFSGLATFLRQLRESRAISHEISDLDFAGPYKRIDFIPAIESAIGRALPDLEASDAAQNIERILVDCKIQFTGSQTLPQMLDRLAVTYLEPQCVQPTFIINHPECLSPLAKSFVHPTCNQKVAARAELFVQSHEIVNTYEEENSPLEQRRKFAQQLAYRDEPNETGIDESYLEALEWGLPPTGGWGGGIERICMMMTGATRIGDVLSFGTLRNVVALGRRPECARGR